MTAKQATTAQLKDDINRGLTGDKIAGFDPAAAPLGTDDEAGGSGMAARDVARARANERQNTIRTASRAEVDPARIYSHERRSRRGVVLALAAAAVVILSVATVILAA